MIRLVAIKAVKPYWFSWMWPKIKSSPMKLGVMGKPIRPRLAIRKINACNGFIR
jgi:hypothetical protein